MPELGVWPSTMRARLAFERGARRLHPSLHGRRTGPCGRSGFRYDVDLDVPHYERRHVTICFSHGRLIPHVRADGPIGSPHRYDDGRLCMWFPNDGVQARWIFDDGLVDLLDVTVAHLFREAWWRENDDWLGGEVGHSPITHEEAA